MLGESGVFALLMAPLMYHNTPAAMENLHGVYAEENFYLFASKLEGTL